jgi:hypothetical protein
MIEHDLRLASLQIRQKTMKKPEVFDANQTTADQA